MDSPVASPRHAVRIARSLIACTVLLAMLVFIPSASAATPADEACRTWYGEQIPEEQAREDNEAQVSNDVDGDGCIGMFAAEDSNGPAAGALESGGVGDQSNDLDETTSEETPGDDPDCAAKFEAEGAEEQLREREEDAQFGVDGDGDGCIAGESAEDATSLTGSPTEAPETVPDAGGLGGMVLGFFTDILEWLWDNTFGFALETMSEAFETSVLALPDLQGRSDLIGLYTQGVEKLRPAILVGILLLGILLMVRGDSYDLAYAGFHGLPKLLGVGMAMAFLPQFMGEFADITAGISGAFSPSGGNVDSAGRELFKAAVGNQVSIANVFNIVLLIAAVWVGGLVLIVSLLKNILYVILFIAGPFALVASLVPGLSSLAGSWFRGVLACAAIPALWSIELGIGTLVVRSPEAIFGDQADALGFISSGAVVSIGAIVTMWIMYKTPFKVVEWAFNVQLPGRGGLGGLAKAATTLAVMVPAKTAIATAVKGAMSGSSAGGSIAGAAAASSGARDTSKGSDNSVGGKGRNEILKMQHLRHQMQQARRAENLSKNTLKYLKQREDGDESRERFMQKRQRDATAPGLNDWKSETSVREN
ncbi:hypothetical protein [Rubrobacter indicoceani]|uniref:hypothetical protein n=1 Tax=Rubrobacter indicoceani TaxID=2051957 RepID=UPI000E5B8301|nr:hypothetical protein [Rubrobacter indicoceani]